jgi:glycosyltransferase involved in cell wall biosynthesis
MDAIQSVLGQEYTSIELCVVDDGSSDNSISIVKQVVTQDQRVKFIHNTKRGIASARNTGINHASGDIITFIDQDDLWTKNKLNWFVVKIFTMEFRIIT